MVVVAAVAVVFVAVVFVAVVMDGVSYSVRGPVDRALILPFF